MADPKPETVPGKSQWSSYMLQIYKSRTAPQPLGTVVFEEIEAKAKEKLKDYGGAFMYAGGSAGTNATYRANLEAFKKWGIIPRMLVNATSTNLETTIFGVTHSAPLFIAPIGVQAIFAPEAEFNPARAAKATGVPFILSTGASRTIEEIAEANGDGHRWYQLYWPKNNDVTLSLLKRAKENNYKALVVTLDTMSLGWRPHDLEKAYIPFVHGVGVQIGTSDPVFMGRLGRKPVTGVRPAFPYDPTKFDKGVVEQDPEAVEATYLGMEWLKEANSGLYRDWEDLKFLRENWEGPLILKGIQSVHDAEKALESGVDGIVVSNHGGRQVDGAIPSLLALEHIMKSSKIKAAQKDNKFTILFDSGIRTGSDIIKALALGAQAVLRKSHLYSMSSLSQFRTEYVCLRCCKVGRPWVYGSVVGGQAGVEQVIRHTLADLDNTLALAGYRSLSDIQGKGEDVLMRLT
ncbi:oxidoreductase [Pholiota conissans]|uniref:Oxidoreductase n=1 Tax=Pholiota conissans TaxID=109636 RepID=A0A9P6CSG6_9AGAR|nr:oxidoreductase [Pholiota conissans]